MFDFFFSATGLYIQGIYRKSPGASSKRVMKATLEEGTQVYNHTAICGSATNMYMYTLEFKCLDLL